MSMIASDRRDLRNRIHREKPEPVFSDGYTELANAIVQQAVKDYRKARNMLKKRPENQTWGKVKKDCLKFFHSRWFRILTDVDPEMILDRLQQEEAV